MIYKKYYQKITDFEMIDENIIRVKININKKPMTILGIYAISDDEPSITKDEFFEKVNDEITKLGKTRELIIFVDLNSKTSRKTNRKIVGLYGEVNQNDNGERLIELCKSLFGKVTKLYRSVSQLRSVSIATLHQPPASLK